LVTFADPIVLDNCGIASVIQTAGDPSGSIFPVGVSTIEFTVTDVNNNTNTCTFTITVNDTEDPIAVCQDITIQLDATGNATIDPSDIDGGSTDNCTNVTLSASQTAFTCADVGDVQVTLTVTDDAGNTDTCIAIVTVEDVTNPTVVCQDITVELDANGEVVVDPLDIIVSADDACGIVSTVVIPDTFDCSNVGDNTVTVIVTDPSGNVASCTATVTVEDNILPTVTCMDITLPLGPDGTASITPDDVATFSDNCGIQTTAVDIEDFDCSDIGTPVTVMVFAQDVNGNLNACMAVVTVVDELGPEVTCPADQTVDPGPNNLQYEVPDYWANGEATATDNCTDPVDIFSQDPAPGTLLEDGVYTVTLCATDDYGNESCCEFELTVESILNIDSPSVDLGSVTMYPNPAHHTVTIGNPSGVELERLSIYDAMGRLVVTHNIGGATSDFNFDVQHLASATYLVVIEGRDGMVTKQLIRD